MRHDRAVAAAHLHRQADRDETLEQATRRRAGERAVEIDDVQSCGSVRGEPPRELDRIAALQRDLLAPSSAESHGTPCEHVHRRDHFELTCYHASMLS